MKGQLWETRPLESWQKAKELRAKWQQSIESKEKVVGQGSNSWYLAFPNITVVEDNPAGAMIANKSQSFARKCRLACETRGWGREICGYHGNCWGSQFLGYQMDGSEFPKRKFVVPLPCVCNSHTKRGEQVRDFEPVPRWQSDFTIYPGPHDPAREAEMLKHKAFCTLKQVNDVERIFGQKFDEEEMIRLLRNDADFLQYQVDVAYYMTFKPTPLSVKDLYSFYTLGNLTKLDADEVNSFWKMFRDEVEVRAKNQIAAVGNERYRWMEAHPPSWHFLKYYRYMEHYGAVCIGSQYSNGLFFAMERKPDGSVGRREYPALPADTPLETREDIFRYQTGADTRSPHHFKIDEYIQPTAIAEFADVFQADGAMLGLWRNGVGCAITRKEQAMRLRNAGLSVMMFEGSQPGERTDMDEKRFVDQLDEWMESQGLSKFED
jgi:hypothetical protein